MVQITPGLDQERGYTPAAFGGAFFAAAWIRYSMSLIDP